MTKKYLQGYHGLVKTFAGTPVYYYQDELGSTSHVASSTGSLLEYYKYDLDGKPRYFNASGTEIGASANNVVDLGNGGSRWIAEIGLYDDRNRFMSPILGRFLQPDPIGFKGDTSNLYRYAGNDWANRTDPLGLYTLIIYEHPIASDARTYFGHVAIATTGQGVSSGGGRYDNKGPNGTFNLSHDSTTHYLMQSSLSRNQSLIVLKTTPQQEKAINRYMDARAGNDVHKLDLLHSNCTTRVSGALERAGVIDRQFKSPDNLMNHLNRLSNVDHQGYTIFKGQGNGDPPLTRASDFKSFDPKSSANRANTSQSGSSLNWFALGTAAPAYYGAQPNGSWIDSQGSNINLSGDSSPGGTHVGAPEQ